AALSAYGLRSLCARRTFRGIAGRPEGTAMTPHDAAGKELTWRGLALGVALTLLFTAANVYLGLKLGITFATSLPAAVISMALLGLFSGSNIRENNSVQTNCTSNGAMAASIFGLPGPVSVSGGSRLP